MCRLLSSSGIGSFVANDEKIPYTRSLWIFGGYFATKLFVVILCAVSLSHLFEFSKDDLLLVEAYASIFGEALAACAAWMLVRSYYELQASNAGKLALGLVGVSRCHLMLSVLGGFTLAASIVFLGLWFPSRSTVGASVLDIYTMNGATLRYSWLATGIVVAPFVEELFFRGVVFSTIASHFNVFYGAIVSIILFMLVHFTQVRHDWLSALAIFALGVTCASIRMKGMSLWMAIATHGSYNAYLTLWVIIYPYG